jgi:hypothetical protein
LWAASGRGTGIVAGRSTRSLDITGGYVYVPQLLEADPGEQGRASVGVYVITLGGVLFGKLCPECQSDMVGLGVVGGLCGVVLLMVLGAKWLWG